MANNLTATVSGFVAGDDYELLISPVSDIPTGQTLVRAWLTVKRSVGDADASALFQKVVTTTDAPGTGQITDDGTTDGTGAIRFDLLPANTALLEGTAARSSYPFDVQVETSADKTYTPVKGTIVATKQVTRALVTP